jgi:hypothetical protein
MADFGHANTRQYYTHTHTLSLPIVAEYLLFVSMGVKRVVLLTHHQAFSVCFRNYIAWYFQGDPSRDYTVVIAAVCSVSYPAVWSLLYAYSRYQ